MRTRFVPMLVLPALVLAACSDELTTEPKSLTPDAVIAAPQMSVVSTLSGPVFPAPGGTTLSSSGNTGRAGGGTWTYSAIDLSRFSFLAWSPTSAALSMNGTHNPLSLSPQSNLAGGVALWTGSSPVILTTGSSVVQLRITLTATDPNGAPLPLSIAGVGDFASIPAGNAVALQITSSGFKLNRKFEASHPSVFNGQFAPFLDVYDALRTLAQAPFPQAQSSFGGGFYYATAPCAAGLYMSNNACVPAPPGSYVPDAGATAAIPCAPGTFQPNAGATSCIPAAPGSFVALPGAITSDLCPAGSFQSESAAIACVPAPAGHYVDAAGAVASTPCPIGTYQPNTSATSCIPAPPGSIAIGPGATSAATCNPGTFQPDVAATACIPAPPGSYVDVAGATAATLCVAGKYQPEAASTACIPSPAGHFVSVSGSTSATPCAPGSYQAFAGTAACDLAPPGSFVNGSGATQATPCIPGTFQPAAGATECIASPPGSFVPAASATSSTLCAPGTYQTWVGRTSCDPAPVGSYVPSAGATAPTPCPAGSTTIETGAIVCQPLIQQTISFTSTPPSPAYIGDSYAVTAIGGGSSNAVVLSASGACSISGSTVALNAAGTCTVTANQAGGGLYLPAASASQSFQVIVRTPAQQATQLSGTVNTLATTGALTSSEASSLTSLLQNATSAFDRGNRQAGENQMQAFINRVQALEKSRRITASQAAALIAAAESVIAASRAGN